MRRALANRSASAARRDVPVILTAIAVVALHVVTDAFIRPEPGVPLGARLIPGLVPLAVLAAAALVVARARPGVRASVALLLTPATLVAGWVAVAELGGAGPDGATWTGLLLVPAGLTLLVAGGAVLWRTRRPTGRVLLRRTLLGAGAVVAAAWVALPVAIAVHATHRPAEEAVEVDVGRPGVPVTIRTGDGVDLAAWYVPSRNGAAVVTYPSRSGLSAHARMLARNGYGVLVLDARGYGASEGAPNAFGWRGVRDVRAAVAWLRARPDVRGDRVAGFGLSVGGEVMIEAAAREDGPRAVVSEGAGERSVRETLMRGPAAAPVLPLAGVRTLAVAVLSGTAPPESLETLAGRIAPRRALLIWSPSGGGGEDLTPAYARAAGPAAELWEIPDGGHTGGLEARPAEYERRVIAFLDGALRVG